MEYEFDPAKNASNIAKHGVPLTAVDFFEWDTADIRSDTRFDYPEPRFEATGYIGSRLYVVIFCFRNEARRIISLRKANPKEMRRYAKT